MLSCADKEINIHDQKRVMLLEHYRSHPNIIGFSNHCFYEKRLRIHTSYDNRVGIQWVDHSNDCEPRWTNKGEVELIIEIIKDCLSSNKYKPMEIGVVTPFRQQANLITENIGNHFGADVCSLVNGVTKLTKAELPVDLEEIGYSEDFERREQMADDVAQAETLRKMLIAMAEDIRVVLIKLADRLHNMRTVSFLPPERNEAFSRETLEIFAPLAHRLGIWEIKWMLEDLAFQQFHRAPSLP